MDDIRRLNDGEKTQKAHDVARVRESTVNEDEHNERNATRNGHEMNEKSRQCSKRPTQTKPLALEQARWQQKKRSRENT